MRGVLGVTAAVLTSSTLLAGEAGATYDCNPAGTVIVYGNGMNTSRAQAKLSLVALQLSLTELDDPDVRFELAYNEREGDLDQLLEVYIQREGEDLENFWRQISGSDWVPDFLKDAWEDAARDFREQQLRDDADLRRHVQMYRALILEGNKVLVVSHSQGNFYANLAYDALHSNDDPVPPQSFGIVGVGTPAARVGGSGPYTTFEEDRVMQAVRLLYDTTLPANITNADGAELDSLNHGFRTAYLKSTTSKKKILDGVETQLATLMTPTAEASSGPITVTLEWGTQPDFDLHVFEPEIFLPNNHVYYGEPQGNVGALDLDDQDGRGPEHYVADCDLLVPGTYIVGVNYFDGDGIDTAHVSIKAGSIVKNYSAQFALALQETGAASPRLMGHVIVTEPEPNKFEFVVKEGTPLE